MFDHHPEPAVDFEMEVGDLQAEVFNWQHSIPGALSADVLVRRFNKALAFKFLPGGECQAAMETVAGAC